MGAGRAHLRWLLALFLVVSLPAIPTGGQTDSTGFERLQEDLEAGLITLDQYVLFGVEAMITPMAPARYVPLGLGGDLAVMEFFGHWEELSAATQTEVLSLFENAHAGLFFPSTDSVDPVVLAAEVQQCVGFEPLGIAVVCTYSTDRFRIAYTVLGPMAVPAGDADGDDVPDYVENVAANLEASWSVNVGLGYQPPDELPVRVTIGLTFSGSGVVGPNQIIHLSNDNGDQYLPRHELFHVFQWEYGGDSVSDRVGWFARIGTDWWMEATAEWAAHLASPDGVQEPDRYAALLPDFLGFPDRALHAHAWIDGPLGRPQYGAFVFAEYLEERLGTDTIRETFERTAEPDQLGALAAVEAVIAESGSTLGLELVDFSRKAYLMNFQDADVGVWLQVLAGDARGRTVADDLGDARPYRTRHTLAMDDAGSGQAVIEPGGRFYLDLGASGDESGSIRVDVDGLATDLVAETLSFSDYPTQCRPPIAFPGATDAAYVRIPIDSGCRHGTLILVHTDPVDGVPRVVSWQASFDSCMPPEIAYGSNLVSDPGLEQYLAATGRTAGEELAFLAADSSGSGLEWPSDTTTRIPAPYLAAWIQNSGYTPPQNPDVFVGIEDQNPRTGSYHLQIRDDQFNGFLIAEHRECDPSDGADLGLFWNGFYTAAIAPGDTAELVLWASYSGSSSGDDVPTHTVNFYFYDTTQTEVGWTGYEGVAFTGTAYDTYSKEPEFSDNPPFVAVDIDDVALTIEP